MDFCQRITRHHHHHHYFSVQVQALSHFHIHLIVQIKDIFGNIGVLMTGETLETLYKQVASEHPKGHVSVESFRNILDEILAAKVQAGDHPMAV